MLNEDIIKCLDDISSEFLDSDYVKEYKELNKIIEEKYAKDIVLFQSAYSKLEEMKQYSKDLKVYEEALIRTKTILFSYHEVKRFKELERLLSNSLKELSNDLAKHISNKFMTKKGI